MSEIPLDGEHIRTYLGEVADELSSTGPQHTLIIVGGALLAWHGLRDATLDVDTIRAIDAEVIEAVHRVADRHGLAPRWVNAAAASFRPVTFDVERCEVLVDDRRLRVLGAPFDQVFVMKLYAGRAQDDADMVRMWPLTGFQSPGEAEALYWEAYPHAPEDEYLGDYIAQIALRAR